MLKLTEAADLEKAGRSLGTFFASRAADIEKSVSSHEAQASHHAALHKAHSDYAEHHKAMHDGLEKGHDMAAHFAKGHAHHSAVAGHHEALAKVHSAEADKCKAERDSLKALAAEFGGAPGAVSSVLKIGGTPLKLEAGAPSPTGNAIADMVQETTTHLTRKTLEMMDNDPDVQQYMRATVMKMVGEAIGNTVVPTNVSTVTPTAPGVTAVPRAGQRSIDEAKAPVVEPRFAKLVAVDEDDNERMGRG